MAENIFNKLEIYGKEDQIKEVREFLYSESNEDNEPNMEIDFNKIVPSPYSEECIDWNYENWGTKYNAFFQENWNPNTIVFSTINYPVPDLMIKLSSIFPDVMFIYHFDLSNIIIDPKASLFIKNSTGIGIPKNYFNYGDKEDFTVEKCYNPIYYSEV